MRRLAESRIPVLVETGTRLQKEWTLTKTSLDLFWNERAAKEERQRLKISNLKYGVSMHSQTQQDVINVLESEDHFRRLNQRTTWRSGDVDLLAKFEQFAEEQRKQGKKFSLSKDHIADMTDDGEFLRRLSDEEVELALADIPDIVFDDVIDKPLAATLGSGEETFMDMHRTVRGLDHKDDLVYYISQVFTGMARHFRCSRLHAIPNETQYFDDLVLPAFEGAFALEDLAVRRFEVPIYGCSERKNAGKDLLTEREAQGHRADAIVETVDALQLVTVETSKMSGATGEKKAKDHYKLARDMRDTWTYIMKKKIKDGKQPQPLTVFGLQVYESEMTFLGMDFCGCFRLHELACVRVPNSHVIIRNHLSRLLKTCIGFARLAKAHHQQLLEWRDSNVKEQRAYGLAVRNIKDTTATPSKATKGGKRKHQDDDDDD
ncbi:hypothetical protein BGZ54_008190 [Gamsiella multidivaricata]|nr:hypothetical protein BGZ54_008190 [Gamsiella multidivaricata]